MGIIPLAKYAQAGHIGVMKLLDHLKASNERVDQFASRIGEPFSTIRKIAYGQRQPSLPLAVKIEAATKGRVTSADMLLPVQVAA